EPDPRRERGEASEVRGLGEGHVRAGRALGHALGELEAGDRASDLPEPDQEREEDVVARGAEAPVLGHREPRLALGRVEAQRARAAPGLACAGTAGRARRWPPARRSERALVRVGATRTAIASASGTVDAVIAARPT